MLHNLNTRHSAKPASAVGMSAVLPRLFFCQGMKRVLFVSGRMAKDPPIG
jgi:hypothetical protein